MLAAHYKWWPALADKRRWLLRDELLCIQQGSLCLDYQSTVGRVQRAAAWTV